MGHFGEVIGSREYRYIAVFSGVLGVHPRTDDRAVWGRGHLPIFGVAWGMVLQGCETNMICEASSKLKAKLNTRKAHLNF